MNKLEFKKGKYFLIDPKFLNNKTVYSLLTDSLKKDSNFILSIIMTHFLDEKNITSEIICFSSSNKIYISDINLEDIVSSSDILCFISDDFLRLLNKVNYFNCSENNDIDMGHVIIIENDFNLEIIENNIYIIEKNENNNYMKIKVPAGVYYIGDPCYVFNDHTKWSKLIGDGNYYIDRMLSFIDNSPVYAHGTFYGDSVYSSNIDIFFPVDSGLIGLVPEKLVGDFQSELGIMKEFNKDFIFKYDNGIFYIDDIIINTIDLYEDEYEDQDYF
jgi:hypothetical protein